MSECSERMWNLVCADYDARERVEHPPWPPRVGQHEQRLKDRGKARDELRAAIGELEARAAGHAYACFEADWKQYMDCPDEELDPGAREMKREVLAMARHTICSSCERAVPEGCVAVDREEVGDATKQAKP